MDFPLTLETETPVVEPELQGDVREPEGGGRAFRTPERWEDRILYVDDDRLAREAFADAAIELGFRIDTADGGGEALTKASRHRYAVIAADLRMPTLNGLSLIQLLRPKWPDASYLIVTGATRIEFPRRANGEPLIDEVVSKPWTLGQLAKILKSSIERARSRRASSTRHKGGLPLLVVGGGDPPDGSASEAVAAILAENECRRAADASQALELVEHEDFRSAVVDLDLDAGAGYEAILGLKRGAPELPIIALGTHDDDAIHDQALKAGAQDYLVKHEARSYNVKRSLRHVGEVKRIEVRLDFLSTHDAVTGLSNRPAFRDALGRSVARARDHDQKIAVLLLDVDRFKVVNDSLGHDVGDRLLKVVAERITNNLRDVDFAARLGGDEFAIVLEGVKDERQPVATAQRLLEALTPPAILNDYELSSTGSIGIALYPDHADSASELLQRADQAMYRAKQDGRDNFAVYSDESEESSSRVLERLTFESGIRHALERDEYVVFFQPQLTIDRKRLVGMEALVRWRHPKAGLVAPGRFMPFLESSGLIKGVGDWVLQTACSQAKQWQERLAPGLRVSVNLSARQFEGNDLISVVEGALERTGLPPNDLELEITESLLMRDTERTRATLLELKEIGVRLAIDDFGTGYSSLAYLTTFPIDCLKIDRSFVHEICTNEDDRTVAEAIIGLGHSLRLDVVAEGVETEEQLGHLSGCDGFQGFLISRPEPADTAGEIISEFS